MFCLPSDLAYPQDSLAHYLEIAARNNPALKAVYSEYSAALERVPQAGALPDPEVQFGYFIRPMELLMGDQLAEIRLMQMFPWFGTLKAARDEASKMAMAKFEEFRDARNQLFYNVRSSYYDLYRTSAEIDIVRQTMELLVSIEQLALIRFKVAAPGPGVSSGMPSSGNTPAQSGPSGMQGMGMGGAVSSVSPSPGQPAMSPSMNTSDNSMVNLLRVQIEINQLRNRMVLLSDAIGTIKAGFNRYLNRPLDAEVFTPDTLMAEFNAEWLSLSGENLEDHPMIKMLEADSAAGASAIVMARRMGYPMLGIGLNYGIIRPRTDEAMASGEDMIMPMISFSIPVYRKKYKSARREAEFRRDAASFSIQNTRNDLRVSFRQALQDLYDADRRVDLYTRQSELAGSSFNLLMSSFSAEGSDFEEILRMQQQLLDYRLSKVQAVADKNRTIAEIIYLSGQ